MQAVNDALRRVPPLAVYVLGLVPLALLVAQAMTGGLGIDPVKALEHRLGTLGLQLLIAGLLVTPLRRFAGLNLLRFRRAIGLLAFLYICLHLLTWVFLDLQLRWSEIWADLVKRPHIIAGMLGFVALVPLALTSNDRALRRLGAVAWQRLHRLTYAAMLLGAVHYLMLARTWATEPILYALAAAGLVALRLVWRRNRVARVPA